MRALSIAVCALLTLSCSGGRSYDQVVGVLIDVSGTYTDEKRQAVDIVKREILPNMIPGDTLLVVRIDPDHDMAVRRRIREAVGEAIGA